MTLLGLDRDKAILERARLNFAADEADLALILPNHRERTLSSMPPSAQIVYLNLAEVEIDREWRIK